MSGDTIQTFSYAHANGSLATSLLDLFSPKSAGMRSFAPTAIDIDHRDLWAADTAHRAKNIAQIFISLGHVAPRLCGAIDYGKVANRATRLADAYLELASDGSSETRLPCGPILERIVVGLSRLFAEGLGPLDLCVSLDHVKLPRDKRRALVLIASELTINALKYAFAPGEPGRLSVSLKDTGDRVHLIVEDDGRGLSGHEPAGDGVQIIDQLGAVLGATITRTCPVRGLKATVSFRQ